MFAKFQVSPYLSASMITKPCCFFHSKKCAILNFQFLCYRGKSTKYINWLSYGSWMEAAEIAWRIMATLWVLIVIYNMNSRNGEKHGAHNRLSRPINVRQQVQLSWTLTKQYTYLNYKLYAGLYFWSSQVLTTETNIYIIRVNHLHFDQDQKVTVFL